MCQDEGLSASFESGSSRLFAITQDGRPADDGLSSGQIALIVIFSILMPLIAFVAAAVVICMKKKRKREQEKDDAEARKQNEQNASHISRLHHNSIKRNPNLSSDMPPHVIKNTWDKSVNNITNSQSLDDCLMNATLYGGVSMYSSENTIASENTCFQAVPTNKSTDMQRAKSQKQLNTDPMKVHRASQLITPPPPTVSKTDGIYDMKRISLLSDAALCNTRWVPSPAPISNSRPILVGNGGSGVPLPQCSPPHM